MLFLVSGTSRSGKTLIAKKILADNQIPYLSFDWLMMGFNHGMPEDVKNPDCLTLILLKIF